MAYRTGALCKLKVPRVIIVNELNLICNYLFLGIQAVKCGSVTVLESGKNISWTLTSVLSIFACITESYPVNTQYAANQAKLNKGRGEIIFNPSQT